MRIFVLGASVLVILGGGLVASYHGQDKSPARRSNPLALKKIRRIQFEGSRVQGKCKIDDMTFNVGDKYCLIPEGETDGECFVCQSDGSFENTHDQCSETKKCPK